VAALNSSNAVVSLLNFWANQVAGEDSGNNGEEEESSTACSRIADSLRERTEWRLGVGLGLGSTLKFRYGQLNIALFHAYGGSGGNLSGDRWSYIAGGGPAFDLQIGRLRLGFSTVSGETRWGNRHFEESSRAGFFLWDWVDDVELGKFGDRSHLALFDVELESLISDGRGQCQ